METIVRCVDRLSHLACFVAVLATVACRRDPVPAAANSVPRVAVELRSTPLPASAFPKPDRRVAAIVSASWDNEDARDRVGEADTVMSLLGIVPGMGVADIGAGTGYYTVRLSPRVGPAGRVYAGDILPAHARDLRQRIPTASPDGRPPPNRGTT